MGAEEGTLGRGVEEGIRRGRKVRKTKGGKK